jgi:nephrocystin-3
MDTPTRTVRVFLSSTFRDFAEERDLLLKKIFPELRRRCRERQVELVDVDLSWGTTEEWAQQGKVLPICLAEIDRSRPFFMGFLGERYDWAPEKDQYDLSLLLEQPWLDEHRGGKSVTELEILHGVLNNPAMEDRAFFYFRDPAYAESKGGAYLSEGSREKASLDALKERIRRSGFPVVEAYPDPGALAERVREDLWKLIYEAFHESEGLMPSPASGWATRPTARPAGVSSSGANPRGPRCGDDRRTLPSCPRPRPVRRRQKRPPRQLGGRLEPTSSCDDDPRPSPRLRG